MSVSDAHVQRADDFPLFRRSWSVLSVSCRLVMEGFFVEHQMGRFIKRIWTVISDDLLVW